MQAAAEVVEPVLQRPFVARRQPSPIAIMKVAVHAPDAVELVQRTLYRLSDEMRGVRNRDEIDPELSQELDDAFDEEYQGPPGSER